MAFQSSRSNLLFRALQDKHLPRFFKSNGTNLEIHWSITPTKNSPKFDILDFWDRAAPVEIADSTLLGLAPEDVILYLCYHNAFTHHFAFGLRPYCDLQAAIQHFSSDLDWDQLISRAQKWGWERGVYLSLRLAAELVGAQPPGYVLDALNPGGDIEIIHAAAKAQTFAVKILPHDISAIFLSISGENTWRKLRLLMGRIFPSRVEIAYLYHADINSPALIFKYPIWWRDLFIQTMKMLFRVQTPDHQIKEIVGRKTKITRWLSAA